MSYETLLLSKSEVEKCITMEQAIEIVDRVFVAHGSNDVVFPAKITLDLSSFGYEAWTNAMPGYIHSLEASGIKWAGGYLRNPKDFGLPYIVATIILQDPEKGIQLSVMDGSHISNLRTGASVAISAKYLANKQASKVAIIGAGMQGRMSLWALSVLRKIKTANVYDISYESSNRFAQDMKKQLSIDVHAVQTPEEAVTDADIVVTVTTADEPIVKNKWLKQGVTAISMGSYQEFDEEFVLEADKIYVDSWDQCSHRGELHKLVEKGQINRESITSEIGFVASGKAIGRVNPEERILVVPIGLGTHDIAIAKKVYEKAVKESIGKWYSFI